MLAGGRRRHDALAGWWQLLGPGLCLGPCAVAGATAASIRDAGATDVGTGSKGAVRLWSGILDQGGPHKCNDVYTGWSCQRGQFPSIDKSHRVCLRSCRRHHQGRESPCLTEARRVLQSRKKTGLSVCCVRAPRGRDFTACKTRGTAVALNRTSSSSSCHQHFVAVVFLRTTAPTRASLVQELASCRTMGWWRRADCRLL